MSTPRRAEIVAAARALLNDEGAEAVTIRRVAAALGIRGPSIYKHVPDKAAIELALVVEVLAELTAVLEAVPATFTDLTQAYRVWALSNPHLHRLANNHRFARSQLPAGLDERASAPIFRACNGDADLARAAWGTLDGLVSLELARRFPPGADLDAVYAAAARAYVLAGAS